MELWKIKYFLIFFLLYTGLLQGKRSFYVMFHFKDYIKFQNMHVYIYIF